MADTPRSLADQLSADDPPSPQPEIYQEVPPEFEVVTDPRKRAVLDALCETTIYTRACEKAGISLKTLYAWRKKDPVFLVAFEIAASVGKQTAEDALWERAIEGQKVPVYWEGIEIGSKRVPSDVLAVFLLKGALPEKYRDRVEHTGNAGGPIEVTRVERVIVEPPAVPINPVLPAKVSAK